MRVIGVLDLLAGRAVHARAGARETYAPISAIAGLTVEGDALALAREYLNLGVAELYVADLDAILAGGGFRADPLGTFCGAGLEACERGAKAPRHSLETACGTSHDSLIVALAALGAPLWLDAAVSSVDQARHALDLGARRVVVGLETLASFDTLEDICAAVGGEKVAFSLDLLGGQPLAKSDDIARHEPAHLIAARAADGGATSVIVIDLARVGTGAGLDFEMIARVRNATPGLLLVAGGGVRGLEDLTRLASAGCDGALVATALHNGRLSAADVAAVRAFAPPSHV